MTDILFYHLENKPLERVLPTLLEKCLERDWRVVVQSGSPNRLDELDTQLWTYADESFLPHAVSNGKDDALQPVLLTSNDENLNESKVRFLVYGAKTTDEASYERIVHIFDGYDDLAVDQARQAWKDASAAGFEVTYWQQDEAGRWQKKA